MKSAFSFFYLSTIHVASHQTALRRHQLSEHPHMAEQTWLKFEPNRPGSPSLSLHSRHSIKLDEPLGSMQQEVKSSKKKKIITRRKKQLHILYIIAHIFVHVNEGLTTCKYCMLICDIQVVLRLKCNRHHHFYDSCSYELHKILQIVLLSGLYACYIAQFKQDLSFFIKFDSASGIFLFFPTCRTSRYLFLRFFSTICVIPSDRILMRFSL